ncbi:hypothetical protein TRIATDRAFT_315217 [Trichoderma atroviride IMI 206040]|uniref:Argininosuccinate lyase C-terminal domain-containing protein n=1 Tax=Hypocrea atroviridis (strain ATCC 20476 / IMI 206040) TaxID=452589 RepID=G9NIV2_HYPAI|nr:uncharacterized protein TRIATDRAFT_315217 [Trichoderma atroviride IMI 206040]EHK49711.1 hypothetical protein TRIATDRAFT_315217 [Trichoderma atroviride IMI 206040]
MCRLVSRRFFWSGGDAMQALWHGFLTMPTPMARESLQRQVWSLPGSTRLTNDKEESWEPMPDHVKTISDSIQIANGILSTGADASCTRPNPSRHRPCRLPRQKGVPFRETHHISGQVAKSEELGIPMDKLSLEQLKAIDGRFTDEVMHTFNY